MVCLYEKELPIHRTGVDQLNKNFSGKTFLATYGEKENEGDLMTGLHNIERQKAFLSESISEVFEGQMGGLTDLPGEIIILIDFLSDRVSSVQSSDQVTITETGRLANHVVGYWLG